MTSINKLVSQSGVALLMGSLLVAGMLSAEAQQDPAMAGNIFLNGYQKPLAVIGAPSVGQPSTLPGYSRPMPVQPLNQPALAAAGTPNNYPNYAPVTGAGNQSAAQGGRYHERKAEGWFWYNEKYQRQPKKVEPQAPQAQPQAAPQPLTATEAMQQIQANIEEVRMRAMLEPTRENMQAWVETMSWATDRANEFGKTYGQVLSVNPELDPSVNAPFNSQYGGQVNQQIDRDKKEQELNKLSKDWGLLYVLRGDCPYCKAFSPVLSSFSDTYRFDVHAVSLDGGSFPEYPDAQFLPELQEKFAIQTVPALYLVRLSDKTILTVSFGLQTVDALENQIVEVTKTYSESNSKDVKKATKG